MIKVYASVQEMDSLREEWNDMYDKAGSVTPFQSFDCCRAALPLLSGRLHVLGWSRKGVLLAIFPLYIDAGKRLRFINDSHSDFCGPLVLPAAAGDFHMCEELADHIRECREIRRIRLENMRSDLFQTSLQYQLGGSLLYAYKQFSFFDCALEHISKKEKYRLGNIASKMEKSGAEWKSFDAARGDLWPEEMISFLTSSMMETGIRKKKYFSDRYLAFVRDVYASGKMMISATFLKDKPAACNLFLKNGCEFIDWMAFYAEPHYNSWNLLESIGWMRGNGIRTLNFARGIYPYKMHNFKPVVGSLTRLHWSRSYTGKVADLLECLVSQIKRMKRTR